MQAVVGIELVDKLPVAVLVLEVALAVADPAQPADQVIVDIALMVGQAIVDIEIAAVGIDLETVEPEVADIALAVVGTALAVVD